MEKQHRYIQQCMYLFLYLSKNLTAEEIYLSFTNNTHKGDTENFTCWILIVIFILFTFVLLFFFMLCFQLLWPNRERRWGEENVESNWMSGSFFAKLRWNGSKQYTLHTNTLYPQQQTRRCHSTDSIEMQLAAHLMVDVASRPCAHPLRCLDGCCESCWLAGLVRVCENDAQ